VKAWNMQCNSTAKHTDDWTNMKNAVVTHACRYAAWASHIAEVPTHVKAHDAIRCPMDTCRVDYTADTRYIAILLAGCWLQPNGCLRFLISSAAHKKFLSKQLTR
jgi:hypothetical protein